MEPATDRHLHQAMPGGVELDLVDAIAETVVGAELGRVGVCLEAPGDRLLGAGEPPELAHHVLRPRAALAFQRLAEWRIRVEQVVIDEGWRLVEGLSQFRPRAQPRVGADVCAPRFPSPLATRSAFRRLRLERRGSVVWRVPSN